MSKQVILVADEKGNHTGEYVDKELAHTGRGKRHLAISVLLYNNRGQVLLQKRKHKVHNNIWDLTGSTHHLHKADGKDETTEETTYRCLKDEYGITEKIPLKVLGGVDYFAPVGDLCENEHDLIVIGQYDGMIKPNLGVAYESKWMELDKFFEEIKNNPKKYAPWAVKAVPLLENGFKNAFFEDLEKFQKEFTHYSKSFFKEKIKSNAKNPKLVKDMWTKLEDFGIGGKAMRPYLVWLGYRIGGGKEISRILPISLGVELVHSFLLIHDDIIDKSDLRRGKTTIHKRYEQEFGEHYGVSQGIIAGDIVLFEAIKLINEADLKPEVAREIMSKLCDFLIDTGYGEALDVYNSQIKPTLADVWKVTELKTARYSFVGPMQIGLLVSGAKNKLKDVENYGTKVGIAFQLQDDILGVYGDEAILGKSVLSDMREGKNTILYLKARALAGKQEIKLLTKIWGNKSSSKKDLLAVQNIIEKSGAYNWCKSEMKQLVENAKQVILRITKDMQIRQILIGSADFVIYRGK